MNAITSVARTLLPSCFSTLIDTQDPIHGGGQLLKAEYSKDPTLYEHIISSNPDERYLAIDQKYPFNKDPVNYKLIKHINEKASKDPKYREAIETILGPSQDAPCSNATPQSNEDDSSIHAYFILDRENPTAPEVELTYLDDEEKANSKLFSNTDGRYIAVDLGRGRRPEFLDEKYKEDRTQKKENAETAAKAPIRKVRDTQETAAPVASSATESPTEARPDGIRYRKEDYYIVIDRENPLSPPNVVAKPEYVAENSKDFGKSRELYNRVMFAESDADTRYLALDGEDGSFKRYLKTARVNSMKKCRLDDDCKKFLGAIFGLPIARANTDGDAGGHTYLVLDLDNPLAKSETIREAENAQASERALFSNPGNRYLAIDVDLKSNPRPLNPQCINDGKCQGNSTSERQKRWILSQANRVRA